MAPRGSWALGAGRWALGGWGPTLKGEENPKPRCSPKETNGTGSWDKMVAWMTPYVTPPALQLSLSLAEVWSLGIDSGILASWVARDSLQCTAPAPVLLEERNTRPPHLVSLMANYCDAPPLPQPSPPRTLSGIVGGGGRGNNDAVSPWRSLRHSIRYYQQPIRTSHLSTSKCLADVCHRHLETGGKKLIRDVGQ